MNFKNRITTHLDIIDNRLETGNLFGGIINPTSPAAFPTAFPNSIFFNTTIENTDEDGPQNNDESTTFVYFIGFATPEQLNRYFIGSTPGANNKKIGDMLATHDSMMVCCYIESGSGPDNLAFRMTKILSTRLAGYSIIDLNEKLKQYISRLMEIGKTKPNFNYTEEAIMEALKDAVPFEFDKLSSVKNFPTEKEKLYQTNLIFFTNNTENSNSIETQQTIKRLCALLVKIDYDIVQTYNQQTNKAKGKLSLADILSMIRKLTKIAASVKYLQTHEFNNSAEVTDFVQKNFSDPSAIGKETHYVINFPFSNMSYEKRKKMLLLFIASDPGKEAIRKITGDSPLHFSDSFDGLHFDNHHDISQGDVAYNLLITASEKDRLRLFQELENEKKLFDLLNAGSDKFNFAIAALISAAVLQPINSNEENQATAFINAYEQQNFYFFDDELSKKQDAGLDSKSKQIEILNKGHHKTPNILPKGYAIAKSFEGKDPFKHDSTAAEREEATYLVQKVSTKKLFNALDIIAFTAESKIDNGILKMEENDTVLLPACMVYVMIKETEDAKFWKAFGIAGALLALPVTAIGFIAALETAALSGIFVATTDLTVDLAFLAANTSGMEENNPEFVKVVNTISFFYGLLRLAPTLSKIPGKLVKLGANLAEAFKILETRAVGFIKQLPQNIASVINKLTSSIQKFVIKGFLYLVFNGKKLCRIDPSAAIRDLRLFEDYSAYQIVDEFKNIKIKARFYKGGFEFEQEFIDTIEICLDYEKKFFFRPKFIKGMERQANLVDEIFVRNTKSPPYKTDTMVTDRVLQKGERFYVVQEVGAKYVGEFGSTFKCSTIEEARMKLAIKKAWKDGPLEVVEYEVKQDFRVRDGLVGEQTDELLQRKLVGGEQQYHFLEVLNKENSWQNFLKKIDPPTLLH